MWECEHMFCVSVESERLRAQRNPIVLENTVHSN